MNKKVNTNVGILIFFMVAVILVITDFVVIGYELDYLVQRSSDDSNEINYVIDADIQKSLSSIAKNELYVFGGKSSVFDLSNKEKLFLSYKNALNFDLVNSFDSSVISNWYDSSSLSNYSLSLDDIMYYDSDCALYNFDESSSTYNRTDGCGFGVSFVDVAYSDVSNYIFKDNKYYISVKYLWFYNEPAGEFSIYGSYKDAYNQENSIGVVNVDDFSNVDVMNNLIKGNNVETYNFVFEKYSNDFKLVDFSKID